MPAAAQGLTRQARKVVESFGTATRRGRSQAAILRRVIESSPRLTWQVNEAVASGRLRHFERLASGTHTAGQYLPHSATIQLPPKRLTPAHEPELVFTLGHEVQHALNSPQVDRSVRDFFQRVYADSQTSRDYTDAIERLVDAHRADEARAHLAGWNALVENRRSRDPSASLRDIARSNPHRAADFVEESPSGSLQARANIDLNPDLSVDLSPENIKGMGHNFFDKAADEVGLGHHGDSDYTNYYTAWAVGEIAQLHSSVNPGQPMRLDMAHLNATRYQIEQNGISLGPGANQPPVPYVDTSTRPPASGHFHHTIATHRHVPLGAPGPRQQDQLVPGTSSTPVRLAHLSFAGSPQKGASSNAGSRAAAHAPRAARGPVRIPSADSGRR